MKTYQTAQGKTAGTLKDGKYRKRVLKSKHKMNVLDAWGIDEAIVKKLEKDGCEEIRILETEDNIIYHVPFIAFQEAGFVRDFGYGEQRFLPLDKWNQTPYVNNG